jgi:hypothetical protein
MNFFIRGNKKSKQDNKRTIFMIMMMVVLMVSLISTSNTVLASGNNPQTELSLNYYGTARLLFIPAVGYGINNIGSETAENIIGQFTIEGGLLGNIDFDATYDFNDIQPGRGLIVSYPHAIDGFGLVTVSVHITCDNADPIIDKVRGFQIGLRTIIFG